MAPYSFFDIVQMKYFSAVEVEKIEGFCPVYKVGDTFYLSQGYRLVCSKSCDICVHALGSLMTFMVGLSGGLPMEALGLGSEGDEVAHVQCLDPGPPYTQGGTVTFGIRRVPHIKD